MSDVTPNVIFVVDRRQFTGAGTASLLGAALTSFTVRHVVSLMQADLVEASLPSLIVMRCASYDSARDLLLDIESVGTLAPGVPIALFGKPADPEAAERIADLGVRGFFSEFSSSDVIAAACLLVIAGEFYHYRQASEKNHEYSVLEATILSESPVPNHIADGRVRSDAERQDLSFTRKEVDVLQGLTKGQPNKTIASQLSMAENTVKIHIRSILKKLGASNRTEAVVFAHRLRLFDS